MAVIAGCAACTEAPRSGDSAKSPTGEGPTSTAPVSPTGAADDPATPGSDTGAGSPGGSGGSGGGSAGGEGGSGGSSAGGQQGGPGTVSPGLPGPADPDVPEPAAPPVLAWLPVGPASPSDPPPNFWYSRLEDRDCAIPISEQDGTLNLWTAALSVCAALQESSDAAWAAAESDFSTASRPAGSCLEAAVYDALQRAVLFHRQFPAAQPQVAPATGTACTPGLTGLLDQPTLGGIACVPVGGIPDGQVRLGGRITAAGTVLFGQTPVQMTRIESNNYVIPIPPGEPGLVTVTSPGLDGSFPVRYVDDPFGECPP